MIHRDVNSREQLAHGDHQEEYQRTAVNPRTVAGGGIERNQIAVLFHRRRKLAEVHAEERRHNRRIARWFRFADERFERRAARSFERAAVGECHLDGHPFGNRNDIRFNRHDGHTFLTLDFRLV